MRRLAAGFGFVVCVTPAVAHAGDGWNLNFDQLPTQARAHLDCMLTHPSQDGPEPCGLGAQPEICQDAACLWRQLDGWRDLIAYFGESAPIDLRERLAEMPTVPTYVTAVAMDAPATTLSDLDRYCPDADVGEDMLDSCLFDAANAASAWFDLYQWHSGTDPRLRVGGN